MKSAPPPKVGGSLLSGLATLDGVEVENQRVFLRTDLDAPTNKAGEIIDDSPIRRAVPTIKRLVESGARVVIASSFGKAKRTAPVSGRAPKSERNPDKSAAPSIEAAAALLSELSGYEVHLPDACVGDSVKKVIGDLREGQICVLENLLSEPQDQDADEGFARSLLAYCDVYVNDALSTCDGESATTTILPRLLEHRVTGPALYAELEAVSQVLACRALTLVIGGNKLTDKLELLGNLLPRTAHLCVAGVPANTLVRARGGTMGTSHVEDTYLAGARTLIEQTVSQLIMPRDFVVAPSVKAEHGQVVAAGELANNEAAFDLGPATVASIVEKIAASSAVLWLGTIGFHKNPAFAEGTRAIVEAMINSSAFTMVAGDDSVAAARATCPERVSELGCLAGGGGATLALLAGKKLPGVEALRGIVHD
jgi:phosphoglycerate kinase